MQLGWECEQEEVSELGQGISEGVETHMFMEFKMIGIVGT